MVKKHASNSLHVLLNVYVDSLSIYYLVVVKHLVKYHVPGFPPVILVSKQPYDKYKIGPLTPFLTNPCKRGQFSDRVLVKIKPRLVFIEIEEGGSLCWPIKFIQTNCPQITIDCQYVVTYSGLENQYFI